MVKIKDMEKIMSVKVHYRIIKVWDGQMDFNTNS
mgnify:FL=1|jgi:hypothetical protein